MSLWFYEKKKKNEIKKTSVIMVLCEREQLFAVLVKNEDFLYAASYY